MPVHILMPALSPTMSEGNLVKWHKKEGDEVKAGQILAEIETDKATMEIEAVDEGILGRIVVPEGTENVKVNALIGLLLEEGEDASVLEQAEVKQIKMTLESSSLSSSPASDLVPTMRSDTTASSHQTLHTPETGVGTGQDRIFATPLARRIAEQEGVDLRSISGSGPRGRIIKADVESQGAHAAPRMVSGEIKPADQLFPAYQEIKLTNVRKVIAQRLMESKQTAPHFYLTIECEIDALLKARQSINQNLAETQKISVNDFVIKAIAMALKKVPEANAAWGGDHIKIFDRADISVAVASDAGLVTPIVREADQKSLGVISEEMKELIGKARAGKLKPHEFQGGTFSLSNLGMYGIKDFAAVINPPQGCILAVGAGQQQAVVKDGKVEIATIMNCTLSVDHRVVDGAVGAKFLNHFKQMITCPMMMIV